MKKYLFGLFALIVAAGAVAFTTPNKAENVRFTEYFFSFDIANNTPTELNVENPAKWLLSPTQSSTGCTLAVEKACKIKVDAADTEEVGGVRKLKSGTIIVAAEFDTNVFYATAASDVIAAYNTVQ